MCVELPFSKYNGIYVPETGISRLGDFKLHGIFSKNKFSIRKSPENSKNDTNSMDFREVFRAREARREIPGWEKTKLKALFEELGSVPGRSVRYRDRRTGNWVPLLHRGDTRSSGSNQGVRRKT